jgi:membrane protein
MLPALVTRAGLVYGSFATVVGIFTLLYLISQTLVLSVELSTVIEARLSPRGLTSAVLTDIDRRALVLQVRRQERVAGQRTATTFSGGPGHGSGCPDDRHDRS